MGVWDTGAFDNDTAADFASDVEHCSDTEARSDFLLKTLNTCYEMTFEEGSLAGDFEFPAKVEHALAAAAFVADAKNDEHRFTNTSYAMACDPDKDFMQPDAWSHIEVAPPSKELVAAASRAMEKVLRQMLKDGVGTEWRQTPKDILSALIR